MTDSFVSLTLLLREAFGFKQLPLKTPAFLMILDDIEFF